MGSAAFPQGRGTAAMSPTPPAAESSSTGAWPAGSSSPHLCSRRDTLQPAPVSQHQGFPIGHPEPQASSRPLCPGADCVHPAPDSVWASSCPGLTARQLVSTYTWSMEGQGLPPGSALLCRAATGLCDLDRTDSSLSPTWKARPLQRPQFHRIPPTPLPWLPVCNSSSQDIFFPPSHSAPGGHLTWEQPGLPRPLPGCAPGSSATLGSGPGVVPGGEGGKQKLGSVQREAGHPETPGPPLRSSLCSKLGGQGFLERGGLRF